MEGLFSKTFRSGVQPVELAKRLIKEMDAGRTVGVNEVWAPNHFEFTMSQVDAERFGQAEAALTAELKRVARENAAERGWGLVGPPEIVIEASPTMKKGDLRCVATLVEGPEGVDPAPAAAPATVLVREDGGERSVAIAKEVVTIGRMPDCDVVLRDKGASRRHAQIRTRDGVATITDLGSTNGTKLNGHIVQTRELSDGDRITIGATVLEFRSA